MGVLLDYSGERVEYKGKTYHTNTAYDTVLLLQKLYGEENLNAGDKINQALRMLTRNPFKVWLLTEMEKAELLKKITEERINLPPRPKAANQQKLMDFEADSEYIYSSFQQAYGIDLMNERGKLQWKQFCELLGGLPESTKLREVMRIRAMEVPEPTRYNQRERQNIMEMKAYYALPVKGGGGQKGLDMLFSTLEEMAK